MLTIRSFDTYQHSNNLGLGMWRSMPPQVERRWDNDGVSNQVNAPWDFQEEWDKVIEQQFARAHIWIKSITLRPSAKCYQLRQISSVSAGLIQVPQFADIIITHMEVDGSTRAVIFVELVQCWYIRTLPKFPKKVAEVDFLMSATTGSIGVFPHLVPSRQEHGIIGHWTTSFEKDMLNRIVCWLSSKGGPLRLCSMHAECWPDFYEWHVS